MKNILTFLIIGLGLIIFSCADDDQINNPVQSEFSTQLSMPILTAVDDNPFSTSALIDGTIGGEIIVDTTMINEIGDLVRIEARLKIDSGSFEGVREIIMIPNFNDVSIQFFPKMIFNKPVKLQLVYTGNNLEKLGFTRNCKVDFVFISGNGKIEPVDYGFCTINLPQKSIRVSNAKLNHFSRYGFIR